MTNRALPDDEAGLTQAGVTAAVAWSFIQDDRPGEVDPAAHPHLAGYAQRAERLPCFAAFPPH